MRITNENIQELKPNEIFVFGSNLSGIHGGGAARLAFEKFNANWGTPIGIQGNSYAIPTKSENIQYTLSVDVIKTYVDEFLEFAKQHKNLTFLVTEIGCGLAGHSPIDIAPLFHEAKNIENIHLPEVFWEILND